MLTPKTNILTTMSFLSVESKKKAEILDVTLKCSIPHYPRNLECDKIVEILPIKIVHGDHEILGDFIIRKVTQLNMNKKHQYLWSFITILFFRWNFLGSSTLYFNEILVLTSTGCPRSKFSNSNCYYSETVHLRP